MPDSEPLVPLRQLLAEFGLHPSDATCWRWVRKGRNGIRLQVVRSGRLLARRSWVGAFVDAMSENPPEAPPVATPKQTANRHRRNLAALAAD